jgi:uncharacterized protein Yka (UPF0111/DUF47 family)
MDQSLKALEAEIAKIEKKSAPHREKLTEAYHELEKHRNTYGKVKEKLMPKIQEAEGELDDLGQNKLQRLIRERNALIRQGVRE